MQEHLSLGLTSHLKSPSSLRGAILPVRMQTPRLWDAGGPALDHQSGRRDLCLQRVHARPALSPGNQVLPSHVAPKPGSKPVVGTGAQRTAAPGHQGEPLWLHSGEAGSRGLPSVARGPLPSTSALGLAWPPLESHRYSNSVTLESPSLEVNKPTQDHKVTAQPAATKPSTGFRLRPERTITSQRGVHLKGLEEDIKKQTVSLQIPFTLKAHCQCLEPAGPGI